MERTRGFTLVELLVTLALIAFISGVGLPAWRELGESARLQTLVSGYLHTFNTARVSALMAGRSISFCPADGELACGRAWGHELVVFYDDDRDGVIARAQDIIDRVRVSGGDSARITLRAFGRTNYVALRRNGHYRQNGTFRFCIPGRSTGRAIVINVTGRARTEAIACPP